MSNVNNSKYQIIDYDPKYLDQQLEIRDEVAKDFAFSSKELSMSIDDAKLMYGSDAFHSCNAIKYAIDGDKLLGFATCSIHNSINLNLNIEQIEDNSALNYPMVREGYFDVIPELLRAIAKDLRSEGIEKITCDIAQEHQNMDQVIEQYFSLDKPLIRKAIVDVGDSQNLDLPAFENVRETRTEDEQTIKDQILADIPVLPEEHLNEIMEDVKPGTDRTPNLVMEDPDTGDIIGWISAELKEDDPNYAIVQLPFVKKEEYETIAVKLVSAVLRKAAQYEIQKVEIMPIFRPDVLDKLEELGIEFETLMGRYKLELDQILQ